MHRSKARVLAGALGASILLSIAIQAPATRAGVAGPKTKGDSIDKVQVLGVWEGFRSALMSKDHARAREYIYPRYLRRMEAMKGGMGGALRWFGGGADSLELTELATKVGYAVLRYDATYRNDKFHLTCFIINEDGRYYLTFPADAMTRNWDRQESAHFIFIFDKDKADARFGLTYPTNLAIRLMEEHYARFTTLLGVHMAEKIEVYLANSVEETAMLAGETDKAEGYSLAPMNIVISTFPFGVMHEVMHVLEYTLTQRYYGKHCDYLSHGLVEYGDGNNGTWKGYQATAWMKKKLGEGTFKPLREIDDYPETASLTQYLMEEFGADKYRRLELAAVDNEHFTQALKDIYGFSIDKLENNWIRWIKNSNVPTEPMYGKEVEFRIITNEWDRKHFGRFTVWCDTHQKMPSAGEVRRVERRYLEYCRKNRIAPLSEITFYLANSRDHMVELFTGNGHYRSGNVMADTTFAGSSIFLAREQ